MAALKQALSTPAPKGLATPPNLRMASRPQRSCASCLYFKAQSVGGAGVCRLYNGTPVKSGQVCDAWKAP